MCERYVLPDQAAAEREFLPARAWWKFTSRYNVAAQQYVPAIRWHDGQSEAVMMRWGFIPSWTEGQPASPPPVIVELNEIQDSLMFRAPWLNSQRCILPGAGFYAASRQATALDDLYFTPAFVTFDAKLAYEAERWSVALIGKNLADRRYYEPFPSGLGVLAPAEPLTVYLVATAKY